MATLILSMDASVGYSRIRRASTTWLVRVENVDVYPDTGRVVVTGWANADEVVSRLESRLRTSVSIVSKCEARFEISSSEEDESDDDDESSSSEEEDDDDRPAGEWDGVPNRTHQPWSGDRPVLDPTSWFYNFTFPHDDY